MRLDTSKHNLRILIVLLAAAIVGSCWISLVRLQKTQMVYQQRFIFANMSAVYVYAYVYVHYQLLSATKRA